VIQDTVMQGRFQQTVNRIFSAALIAGGITGVVMAAGWAFRLAQQHSPGALFFGLFCCTYAWATFVGIRLWQGTALGVRWATILFVSQIPVIALPNFRYEWFTGGYLGTSLRFADHATGMVFGVDLGANFQFFLGGNSSEIVVGANLFALVALILLLRANRPVSA
jgi:hypothetical protein